MLFSKIIYLCIQLKRNTMTNKALKIDVVKKTVEEVEIKDWREISKQIGNGCEIFTTPVYFLNSDCIYVDDEGLLREQDIMGGFLINGYNNVLVNNAIILGTDEDGNSCDVKLTKEELLSELTFIDQPTCKEYARLTLERGNIIYTFK